MTKIILTNELLADGVNMSLTTKHLGLSRRTIMRWSQAIEMQGSLDAFLGHYQQAKKTRTRNEKWIQSSSVVFGLCEKNIINVVDKRSSDFLKRHMVCKSV